MKGLTAAFTLFLLLSVVQSLYPVGALTGNQKSGMEGDIPVLSGTGGPDDYGYIWIDGDEPGGPTFNWVDITGVGTQVTGLGDDNSVGPFMIGFEFPYYWYTVDRFYVGSNGWISFSSGQNFASPFPQLPNSNLPNDLLACLAGDIDFTKGGTCYYYTSPGLDSLVVSYIGVPEFNNVPPTSHTFQVILTRADSTITCQYGEQIGDFSNGSGSFSMGIENSTGTIGLSYFFNPQGSPPPDTLPFAESTVVDFVPPDSTAFVAHDIGVVNALTERGQGVFVNSASSVSVWSDLKNFGNQVENLYGASITIEDESQTNVYSDSIISTIPIAPSEIVNFVFDDPFTPIMDGLFTATFGGHLPPGQDIVPENDEIVVEIHSVRYPALLLYDDGLSEASFFWSGDSSGFGNEFEPPEYPTYIEYAEINFDTQGPGNVIVSIYDDDGVDGGPGTVLATRTISVNSPGFRTIDFTSDVVVIDSGKFFIGGIAATQGTVGFFMDNNTPYSRRGWEYTGGWSPSRLVSENDIMVRVGVSDSPPTSIGDEGREVKLPSAYALSQNYPNPFNPSTTISFDLSGNLGDKQAVNLSVYDIRGRLVRTLIDSEIAAGSHKITWDGMNEQGMQVSSGIYLYTLKTGEQSLTRKMVVLE